MKDEGLIVRFLRIGHISDHMSKLLNSQTPKLLTSILPDS